MNSKHCARIAVIQGRRTLPEASRARAAFLALPLLLAASVSCVAQTQEEYRKRRESMVESQIVARGVQDARVLQAMREVPRHQFVPPQFQAQAYLDRPLPIGEGQTISQPYIVALMTELLHPQPTDTVLEIGTGSGYQAAVLSRLARRVYSIEIVPSLARESKSRLERLGFSNVTVKEGNGYLGWPEAAPFDGIVVTAAPPEIPQALVAQLRRGGRMVVPVGKSGKDQNLMVLEKSRTSDQILARRVIPVRFVPMVEKPPSRTAPEKQSN